MATLTQTDHTVAEVASTGSTLVTDGPPEGANGTTPTFHAKVKPDGLGESYAEIKITCHFRKPNELRDWIIAGTLRLLSDIDEKTGNNDG